MTFRTMNCYLRKRNKHNYPVRKLTDLLKIQESIKRNHLESYGWYKIIVLNNKTKVKSFKREVYISPSQVVEIESERIYH